MIGLTMEKEKETLEPYKELVEQFDAYLNRVANKCQQTLQECDGTVHEASARSVAYFSRDLLMRWSEARQAAIKGSTYSLPSEITIEKEDLPKKENGDE
jgi:hypothetical protein